MTTAPSNPVPLQPGAIVQLAQDLSKLSSHVQLRHIEWGVLLAVTGQHTVAQIGDHFELSPPARQEIFERLRHHGLIEERSVNFNEYVRARAVSGDDTPGSLAQFLTPGAALGAIPTPAASAPAAPESQTEDSSTIPLVTQVISTRATTPPVASFEPLEPLPVSNSTHDVASTPQDRRLSLKSLMRFIIDRAADLNAGQLDVYRVFIRIDSQLLKRNGITTLRFEEDHLVSDPALEKALANSLQHTLGLPCPEEVFVAA